MRKTGGIYTVQSESGNTYRVDVALGESANPAIPVVVMTSSKAEVQTLEDSISDVEACIEKQTDPERVVDLFRSSLAEQ